MIERPEPLNAYEYSIKAKRQAQLKAWKEYYRWKLVLWPALIRMAQTVPVNPGDIQQAADTLLAFGVRR